MVSLVDGQLPVWAWLGPVLTFCGSVLLFAGSMFTLWLTNRAADHREWEKWRRETLLRLGSDAVVAALDVDKCYAEIGNTDDAARLRRRLSAAATATQRIFEIAEQLHLIGTDDLAQRCAEMADAAYHLELPAADLLAAQESCVDVDAAEARLMAALTELQRARFAFVDAGHRELSTRDASPDAFFQAPARSDAQDLPA